MSKSVAVIATAMLLAGCGFESGKFDDVLRTGRDGYSIRCIDGTAYVVLSGFHATAITPHLSADGKPRGCQ